MSDEPAPDARATTGDVERVFREEYGRAVAVLTRVFGDIGTAEDAVQDAFTTAAARWPETGSRPARRGGSSPPPATAPSIACAARRRAPTGTRRRPCSMPATSRSSPPVARRTPCTTIGCA